MTKIEFDNLLSEINAECKRKINNLQKQYAESNNPVKVGDIITDHYHTIKVQTWEVMFSGFQTRYPCLVYKGVQYTKTGNVAKRQNDTSMWQDNVRFINDKAIRE